MQTADVIVHLSKERTGLIKLFCFSFILIQKSVYKLYLKKTKL